jgi:FkbM family methyltransferase
VLIMPLAKHILAGRAELESYSRHHSAGVSYGDHRLLCRLLGDQLAFVDTRDLMLGPRLVLDGFWESWVTLAVARYLKPGMWCVDVGANYGYYTLLMASVCGATGRVVACEPNPLLADTYLPQNLALNGFYHGVEICPKVISDVADRDVDFILHEADFATSSVEQWAYSHRAGSVRAKTTTIDDLTAHWPRLDLVKIDAEGGELLVWEGMRRTRARFPQAAIVVELHLPRDPENARRLLAAIQRDGYAMRAVNYAGQIMPTTERIVLGRPDEHWTLWLAS